MPRGLLHFKVVRLTMVATVVVAAALGLVCAPFGDARHDADRGAERSGRARACVAGPGQLAVPFQHADGRPLRGVAIDVGTGDGPVSATSDRGGCARVSGLWPGEYSVTYGRRGHVTPGGHRTGVLGGVAVDTDWRAATPVQRLDRPGTVRVRVVTRLAPGGPLVPAAVREVSLRPVRADGSLTTVRVPAGGLDAGWVFPAPGGYRVQAGTCAAGDPARFGRPSAVVAVRPGRTGVAEVFAPTVRLQAPAGGFSHVVTRSTDAGCDTTFEAWLPTRRSMTLQLPFGRYEVCVDRGRRAAAARVAVVDEDPVTARLPAASRRRPCPPLPPPGPPAAELDAAGL